MPYIGNYHFPDRKWERGPNGWFTREVNAMDKADRHMCVAQLSHARVKLNESKPLQDAIELVADEIATRHNKQLRRDLVDRIALTEAWEKAYALSKSPSKVK